MAHTHISLNNSQLEAFNQAAELVEEDADTDDLSRGEVVKRLADAYRGLL